MCRLAQIEYRDQIQKAEDERRELLEERRKAKYEKHYDICQQVIIIILDISSSFERVSRSVTAILYGQF